MSSSTGYGTTPNSSGITNGGERGGDEEQPLLRKPPLGSILRRWRRKLRVDIKREWSDLVLLFCYIITGLLDSSSISIWGSFVSMQTGNTVYIGLGLAAPRESTRWIKSATSLGCFCVGSFCFSRFHRYFSPKRRWVLCASFAFQMTLIIGAAIIVTLGPTAGKEDISWNVLVPIALVAFQACGQAVASRALKHNALTSVVLTSIYCDLFSDANLFTVHNVERNQRTGAPLLLLFGACMGGLLAHSEVGIAGALWIAAVLKFFIVLSWFYWPADPSSEED